MYKPFERLGKFQIIAQGVLFVLGVIAWRLFEANLLSILLFNTMALWSWPLPTQRQRRIWTLISIGKVAFVLCIFKFGGALFAPEGVLLGNTDQFMYLKDGIKLSELIVSDGIFFDYFQHFSLHNRSYHYLVGLAFYILDTREPIWIILIHLHFISVIAILGKQISERLGAQGSLVAWILFLMPFMNIYSLFLLRDVFMAFLLTASVWSILHQRLLLLSIAIFFLIYTRLQLGLLVIFLFLFFVALSWLGKLFQAKPSRAYILSGLVLATFTSLLNPNVGKALALWVSNFFYLWPSLNFYVLVDMLKRAPLILSNLEFLFSTDYVLDPNYSYRLGIILRVICPELLLVLPVFLGIFLGNIGIFRLSKLNDHKFVFILSLGLVFLIYIYGYLLIFGVINARHFLPWIPAVFAIIASLGLVDKKNVKS